MGDHSNFYTACAVVNTDYSEILKLVPDGLNRVYDSDGIVPYLDWTVKHAYRIEGLHGGGGSVKQQETCE